MAENKDQEPVVVVINSESPTTKQQLTTAAIQLGSALALPVLIAGSFVVAGAVGKARDKIRRRHAAPALVDSTDDLPDNQE